MLNSTNDRPTIGFVGTWPVYQGTTIDRYAHSLIQGISAAAYQHGCNLLLGCGFSATGNHPPFRQFWPVPGPGVNFVPVGPWNTDGLIIVPDELTNEQSRYVRDLLDSGFPVIFTTPEGPGPVVAVDNTLGIQQAFEHLLQHGHRQIAFIAGHKGRGGDSEERLQAYRLALKQAGLPEDPRLIAFGEHRREGGRSAMQQILDSGGIFTGLIASNDLSCLGAIQCLTEAGRVIPDDVAVIGFDDILDARSLSPSLTTIRHPTFSLGYQSMVTLLDHICGRARASRVVVSPRLIIRQSCGCPPTGTGHLSLSIHSSEPTLNLNDLAYAMARASLIEARNSLLEDLQEQCLPFLEQFLHSLRLRDANLILGEIKRVLAWTDERGEDPHIWQAGVAILYQNMNTLLHLVPEAGQGFTSSLIDRVHLEISDQIQRRTTRSMIGHMDMMSQLGLMTAELLTAMNISESAEILTRHLPQVGIRSLLVARYDEDREDLTSQATVLFTSGLPGSGTEQRFETREFPVQGIYPADEPVQLTILPLEVDGQALGFAAFDAPNPELCAAIVHNLSAALRTSQLYNDAVEGRRMAEQANQLKSRFLSMVSHELRTPLSLIVGLSEMVLREGYDGSRLPQGSLRDMQQINTSAQHLARLIGDVLDLTSSEAGQLHILREPLDLTEVLGVAAKIGEQLAREKGLTWNAGLPARGPWVLGDRTRLRQVALNLISNAVKFTPKGEVRLDVSVLDERVVVSVSDTGIGISPAEQSTIFNEFYRSKSSIESGSGGLGLGLAISRQLILRHGGSIEVRSPGDLGSGSTFSFSLSVMAEIEATPALPSAAGTHNLVLILTEGNRSADEISEYLTSRGFDLEVCRVDEDSEWLSKVTQAMPTALLLEQNLASREGWGILGLLKRQSATKDIPVLAWSLHVEEDQGQLLELNYFHKPLELDQLTKELEHFHTSSSSPQTVLVVDDDPDILKMHSRLIEQTGRQVLQARNGREALALIEKQRPGLILLDLIMPEMDGFAVLEALHARQSTRNIPVIILTAHLLSEADLERCNRGVASILGKGLFTTEETLKHVEAALMRRQVLSRPTQQLIRKAMAYIHRQFSGPLTREEIADHIGISADYLTDCFRQELGITPTTYIRRYRIREACELLRNSDQTITQIALAVGFSDSAHFTRTFQREMKITPRAFRHHTPG